ncbi:hypothetical protein SteCoe_33805 [Stentor coeruleus]|uniref:Uncharacterized protein n=1 Tax=Stentor coeruleus TaxID=5963 RepID=A0A1R2AWB1_9CILI|nr:hypothetical protein SteCoe_33805 [Stentor coeruleus]
MNPIRLVQQSRKFSKINLEPKSKVSPIENNNPIILPKALDDFAVHISDHIKKSSNNNLTTRVKVLEEIGFTEYFHNSSTYFTFKNPSICFADFSGKKELFLRRAGLWEAYKSIRKTDNGLCEKIQTFKIHSPVIKDYNCERKILLNKVKPYNGLYKNIGKTHKKSQNISNELSEVIQVIQVQSKIKNCDHKDKPMRILHAIHRGNHIVL